MGMEVISVRKEGDSPCLYTHTLSLSLSLSFWIAWMFYLFQNITWKKKFLKKWGSLGERGSRGLNLLLLCKQHYSFQWEFKVCSECCINQHSSRSMGLTLMKCTLTHLSSSIFCCFFTMSDRLNLSQTLFRLFQVKLILSFKRCSSKFLNSTYLQRLAQMLTHLGKTSLIM